MLEMSAPAFNWSKVRKYALDGTLVMLLFHSDLDGANNRQKMAYGSRVRDYHQHQMGASGAPIVLDDGDCSTHILQTIIEHSFNTPCVVAKFHATAHVAANSLDVLLHSLREVVSEDLHDGGFHVGAQPRDHRSRNHKILDLTLFRGKWTRGRDTAWDCPEVEQLAMALLRDLPGDWSKPQKQVFASRELNIDVWIDKITSLLAKAIIEPLAGKEVAANKWWTVSPTLENQGLGQLLHQILPRVVRKVRIGDHDQDHLDAAAKENPDLWYKAYSGKKAKQSAEFLGDQPRSSALCACMLVHCEPLDRLSNRMQHLDLAPEPDKLGTLAETVKNDGLLKKCQRQIWHNLCARGSESLDARGDPPPRSGWPRDMLMDFLEGPMVWNLSVKSGTAQA